MEFPGSANHGLLLQPVQHCQAIHVAVWCYAGSQTGTAVARKQSGVRTAVLPSVFNLRVPVASGDVFLMNTLTDAQIVVSPDVAALLDASPRAGKPDADTRDASAVLAEHGFMVTDRAAEMSSLESHFASFRADVSDLRVTVLTTLQCNFACEYCYQGDHGGPAKPADRMSMATAGQAAAWIEHEVRRVHPARVVLTFFGGEPLLNLPALFEIAERSWRATQDLGIPQAITLVTNGVLLTPEIATRLLPLGLCGIKVTLDGTRETHDLMRPMRGGQGTFDRIIENMRQVAPLVPLTVGGNFDASTAERYPALLDFLRQQEFADRIAQISFKPIIRQSRAAAPRGVIPLTPVEDDLISVNGSCVTAAAGTGGSVCDSCRVDDDQMTVLQRETRKRGFATLDGVHMGPCELYRSHSHTIGPDGSLYACPGFTGDNEQSVGHIDREPSLFQSALADRLATLSPWRLCGDCAFIPVCGGGCAVAAHTELGDMSAPSCHKHAFESALVNLAEATALSAQGV